MILSLEDDCLHRTACGAGGGTRSLQERVNPLSPDRRGYIFQSLFAPRFSLLVEEAPQQALQSSQEYLSSTLSQTGIHGRAWEAMMMDAEKPLRPKVAASRAIPPTRPRCFSRLWPGKVAHYARRILPSDWSVATSCS